MHLEIHLQPSGPALYQHLCCCQPVAVLRWHHTAIGCLVKAHCKASSAPSCPTNFPRRGEQRTLQWQAQPPTPHTRACIATKPVSFLHAYAPLPPAHCLPISYPHQGTVMTICDH
uniref:Uncharacterized protein n=1 Tax=Chelonoidis abingdonii TaxID=106734 RepID=A0A8C0H4R0_CHEAB